jgi:hypothetical protein
MPLVLCSTDSLEIGEEEQVGYGIKLSGDPCLPVTVNVSPILVDPVNPIEILGADQSGILQLQFDQQNWDQWQMVSVKGIIDPEPPPSKTLAIAQYLADDPTEGSVIPVTILDKKTGGKGYLAADINFDAQVNFKDLGLWMADWLKSTRAEDEIPWDGPWQNQDIGTTGGDAFYDPQTEVWTIHGNGADIWGTSDQFHYVYQQPGLCQLTVTVHSLEDTHEWAKAGVMARAELTTDSGYAMIVVTPHRGVAFQWRPGSGEETQSIHGGPAATITTPVSLRLVVNGDTATGYYYSNGSWVQLGSVTLEGHLHGVKIGGGKSLGMMLTSHAEDVLATATFGREIVSLGPQPEPPD